MPNHSTAESSTSKLSKTLEQRKREVEKAYIKTLQPTEDLDPILLRLRNKSEAIWTKHVLNSITRGFDALTTVHEALIKDEESNNRIKETSTSKDGREALEASDAAEDAKRKTEKDLKEAIRKFKMESDKNDRKVSRGYDIEQWSEKQKQVDAMGEALKSLYHKTVVILARPNITISDIKDCQQSWKSVRELLEEKLERLDEISSEAYQLDTQRNKADEEAYAEKSEDEPDISVFENTSRVIKDVKRNAEKLKKEKQKLIDERDKGLVNMIKASIKQWEKMYQSDK